MSEFNRKNPHPLADLIASAVHSGWGDILDIDTSQVTEDGLGVYVEGYLDEDGSKSPVSGVIRVEEFTVGWPEDDWEDEDGED